ncbi:acetyl-CoA carboxylase biotin carboxylase subunit [Desulfospira joergensenii]|uniref:acetyl-CoA carboxylase biotin carboxylase subunit n=1 Tax=Desulfospira joergensenii TaxID=53329 RepID=UPI0003B5F9BC|nr:biotin carboxylase N-terminal domain-containing protein [Desulfospira joergensenii]
MPDITKVLIANRGEIACRILKTLDRMGIPGVLVYHPVDAGSPALKMAAQSVRIQGKTPAGAYLDMEKIIQACEKTGADAVHPGFGFLAENPDFARSLEKKGITFIGPMPETMELMGNKVRAQAFCRANGFPVLPSKTWTKGEEDFISGAKDLGLPLLIKAAAGGGGKGMHIVRDLQDLKPALELARAEAQRFFGNDEIYAERYIENPRHIEVQILADHHGRVIHLGERDCSIQRRFQKIMEESPAPGLTPELRQKICDTAVNIARRAEYCNAGTVEFMLGPDKDFFFLEMNTRLQVEHPVTEMVTGLDLVELQIRAARGEALNLAQDEIQAKGHSIELRICAEDPDDDFSPAPGSLVTYNLPEGKDIRVENGFTRGMKISPAFDPMLAKIIVRGDDRTRAIEQACRALDQTLVLGLPTNIDFLARILSLPAYAAGKIHTGFIDRYGEELTPPPLSQEQRELLLTAAALASREFTDPAFDPDPPHGTMGNWRN